MLASNSSRNSQPELIADDGQGMFFPACPKTLAAARPESGTRPRGKKMERHIEPASLRNAWETLVRAPSIIFDDTIQSFSGEQCTKQQRCAAGTTRLGADQREAPQSR
jgi:hypothetical protein